MTTKKGLRQDVPTRWNSTFIMLDSCIAYEKVFTHLKLIDDNYAECPTLEEWAQIAVTRDFIKAFYDVTNLFSGTKYPTSNLYFNGIWNIQKVLEEGSLSSNEFISKMAKGMREKFDKYWSDYSLILVMALVLDPRFKLQFVEFSYKKLYTIVETKKLVSDISNRLDRLFEEYSSSKSNACTSKQKESFEVLNGDTCTDKRTLKAYLQEFADEQSKNGNSSCISELEVYLKELRLPVEQEINILEYWKSQVYRFLILSRMSRDILTIPVSTVASESAFSIGGRILDVFRSSLTPENAEALVTTRDWFCGIGVDYLELKADDIVEDVLAVDNPSIDIDGAT